MNIDRFIARFIPIIGAVLFVIGLGYLIYTSVWLTIAYEAKIGVGLFASLLLIGAGYSLRESVRFYADVTIGAGVLLFYGTLVYASRTTSAAEAFLPEHVGLVVSLLFTAATAYFASERKSREILVLSLLGAYLMPFVIGQEDTWRYEIAYNVYLLYFFAVNLGIFALSRRLWMGDIVPLNGLGLLIGTTSLHALTRTSETSAGFFGGDLASGIIYAAIVGVYVSAMILTNDRFPERYRQFFSFGYVVPFLWFALNATMLDLDNGASSGLYAFVAIVYFAGWYLSRAQSEQAVGRAFLYTGAIASFCLAALHLFSNSSLSAGLAIGLFSLLLWGLAMAQPLQERVAAYLSLGIIGLILAGFSSDTVYDSKALTILIGTFPLVLAWALRERTTESNLRDGLQLCAIVATFLAFCTGASWIIEWDIPFTLVLWTLPGLIGLCVLFARRETFTPQILNSGVILGSILISAGYFITFFELANRLTSVPYSTDFLSETGVIGALSALGFFMALAVHRYAAAKDPEQKASYPLVLLSYSALLLTVNHEALALMNDLALSQNARIALVTPLWIAVAAGMMFVGVKSGDSHRPEKLLGVLLFGLTLLKILFFDLDGVTTEIRIAVLMVVGGGLMAFSYALSRRGYLNPDAPDEAPEAATPAQEAAATR
jgi:hypothetical protein